MRLKSFDVSGAAMWAEADMCTCEFNTEANGLQGILPGEWLRIYEVRCYLRLSEFK
jgi:hypothetical protein